MEPRLELGATWRAAEATEELRRSFADSGLDDGAWDGIEVPGHWRSTPAFAASNGPLLYRRAFADGPPDGDRRRWLELDGLFYQGDVWLDGAYLGDTEGYFFPHHFEITGPATERSEHVLAVEVTCAPQPDRTAKRNLTGVFQDSDCIDPEWNPGGVWRPVRIAETGPVRIGAMSVLCREASAERAVLAFDAVLDAAAPVDARVATTVGAVDHEVELPLAAGENRVQWAVTIPEPRLWWPWALGDQPLYDVAVDVVVAGALSDRSTLRTGLRQVTMRDWTVTVNGERLFLKGSNHGPTRMAIAEATAEEVVADVALAKDAGLDFLRVHAHVARPELYAAADEAGLLLWQDMPLQRGYARGVRRQAVRQAQAAVNLLGHHPSVFLWCGHNEPVSRTLVSQQAPTWNRSVLDRSIKRALERADATRPVVAHSGVLPHLPQLDGTDSHLYHGWYRGDERDFPAALAAMPRLARFVSEFGAQAVPDDASFCAPEQWPDLDWDHIGRRHALQRDHMDRVADPSHYATFDGWRDATQQYQATLITHHVEAMRRIKYRPAGGFAQFCLADSMPAVSFSVLGHDRSPKAGFHALVAACRPVIVVADRLPATMRPGDAMAVDVHVVSDLRHDIDALVTTARLSWPGGSHSWKWRGSVPADECVRVATIQFTVPPDAAGGELRLDLRVTGPVTATNHDVTTIVPR